MTTETRDPAMLERLARGRATAAANRTARAAGQSVVDPAETNQAPREAVPDAFEARRPTANEQFLARNIGEQTLRTQPRGRSPAMQKFIASTQLQEGEEITEDADGTLHVGAKLVRLYRPTDWGWEPTNVPFTNVQMCLNSGFRTNCDDCRGDCQPDAMRPMPNSCPGRKKFATMRCPICRKVIYDFGSRNDGPAPKLARPMDDAEGNDGTEIGHDAYTLLGPETRLKAAMDQHIDAYHRNSGMALGLVLPEDRRSV